jgi:glycosyltransferase involved in cell wall biosynthesis
MKILFAITSIDKGGAETHLVNLVSGLLEKRINVCIFYTRNDNEFFKKKLETLNVKLFKKKYNINLNLVNFFFDFLHLRKLILQINPDIIHVHLPYMELLTFLVLKTLKKKYKFIITKHVDSSLLNGSDRQQESFFGSFLGGLIYNRAKIIIVISQAVKKYVIDNYNNINVKNIAVIRYGIEYKILSNSTKTVNKFKKKYNLQGYYVLGVAARLVRQKSIDFLIKSFSEYNKNYNLKSKLLIAGKGPLKKELEELVASLNLKKSVKFLGFQSDINTFYRSIDVFCLTSNYEGLGLAILEALAFKKPIITSNCSAMPEIIKQNKNGLLVDHLNIRQLVKAIEALEDPKLRNKISFNSTKLLKKKFSLPLMIKKTIRVYNSNLN